MSRRGGLCSDPGEAAFAYLPLFSFGFVDCCGSLFAGEVPMLGILSHATARVAPSLNFETQESPTTLGRRQGNVSIEHPLSFVPQLTPRLHFSADTAPFRCQDWASSSSSRSTGHKQIHPPKCSPRTAPPPSAACKSTPSQTPTAPSTLPAANFPGATTPTLHPPPLASTSANPWRRDPSAARSGEAGA